MSCCGESRTDAEKKAQQQPQQWNQNGGGPIMQQPGMHPQPSFGGPQGGMNPAGYPNMSMNGYPPQAPTPVSHHQQVSSTPGANAWGGNPAGQPAGPFATDPYGNPLPTSPGAIPGQSTGT